MMENSIPVQIKQFPQTPAEIIQPGNMVVTFIWQWLQSQPQLIFQPLLLALNVLYSGLPQSTLPIQPSVNRIDLQALPLVGPTVTRPAHDPLAVLSLDNLL